MTHDPLPYDHAPAPFGSYPGEQIDDPHQRGLWAPNPGRSFKNEFKDKRTVHLTIKLNVAERTILSSLFADSADERSASQSVIFALARNAAAKAVQGFKDSLAPHVAPENYRAVQQAPAGPSVDVPTSEDDGECLSCQ